MRVDDFDYGLPEDRIAQVPVEPRDASRLMVVRRRDGRIEHRHFRDLDTLLGPTDLLVRNRTRVIPARLYGHKETGGAVEVLLLEKLAPDTWEVLARPGRRLRPGTRVWFDASLDGVCLGPGAASGSLRFRFHAGGPFEEILERIGQMPLPPYIRTPLARGERYQTVYGRETGSAAAPTAGLHFTPELLARLEAGGVETCEILLHVGLGTFRPVQVHTVEEHRMHREYFEVPAPAADALHRGQEAGKRIVAVGTTTVRTLESAWQEHGSIPACRGHTDLFIYPGYRFGAVDAMITNFHLPRSTLLMMVCAFAGTDLAMEAYRTAVSEGYRFFSFGDAMLIE